VKSLVGDTMALIVQNISTVIAGLVIAFTANWILAFIVLAVSPTILMQGIVQMKFLKGFSADAKVSITCSFVNYTVEIIYWGNHENLFPFIYVGYV
jgi:ABC-type multidrug transport system fused ATPase/permease subunit